MRGELIKLDQQYVAGTYARFPLELTSGQGSLLYDIDGNAYIDLGSGIAVNTFGIADSVWREAVTKQLSALQHTSNLYYTEPCARLASMLCQRTGMKKVFFSNSGAEANECAIKAARKYAASKKGEEYYNIITLVNSFHGRTITTLSATGQEHFHKDFQPLTPGFLYAPAGDLETVKRLAAKYPTAAILFECVQGEGGVNALPKEFVQEVCTFCKEQDILVVVDEVQTGNGRTGELYAYMHYGITPDIVSTAKGLGGGLPLGATLFGEKTQNVLGFGDHGSTFGGNPVCCAGAISILERLTNDFLADVKEKSEYIFQTLEGSKGVLSVSGIGLMIGVETQRPAKEVISACMKRGVLCLSAKTKVRFLPALNIPMDLLKQALTIFLEECIV